VFYDPHALKIKNMEPISHQQIREAFQLADLEVYDDPQKLAEMLYNLNQNNTALVFMSSGNFGGLDLNRIAKS